MNNVIAIDNDKCIGCNICALTCSITFSNEFNPDMSRVQVINNELHGHFYIYFTSACSNCGKCTHACPTGSLRLV